MRILHFNQHFFPEYSGASVRLYNLISRLPFEFTVITQNQKIDKSIINSKEDYLNNIKIKRVPLYSPHSYSKLLDYVNIIRKKNILLKTVEKEKFDIVHGHNASIFGWAAYNLSQIKSKSLIMELHAPIEHDYDAFTKVYKTYLLKIPQALDKCESLLVLTNTMRKLTSEYYNIPISKIDVIPNGVDVNKFKPDPTKDLETIKNKLNLKSNVIMYAGYMDKINGIDAVLNNLDYLLKELKNTSFMFIGGGPYENRLIKYSKKYSQVIHLPMVNYKDMPIFYELADLFIIPRPSNTSTESVTPLKLFEAMSMEKPILGSSVGGISEVIKNNKNGYLFEKGNIEDFKNKLIDITNRDNYKVSKNARKTVINEYNWEISALKLQKIYESLIH